MTPSTGVWEVLSTEVFVAYGPSSFQDRGSGTVKRIMSVRGDRFKAIVELEITEFSPGNATFEYEAKSASVLDNCEVFSMSERQYIILKQAIVNALAVTSVSDGGLTHLCWAASLDQATYDYESLAVTNAGGKKRRKRN